MDTNLILDRLELLPENLQQQVIDYVDFITSRYLKELVEDIENEKEIELTDKLKKLLDDRVKHHEQNKYKAKPAMSVLNDIAQKYGYEL